MASLVFLAVFAALYLGGLKAGTILIEKVTPRRADELRYPAQFSAAGVVFGAIAGLLLGIGVLGGIHLAHPNFGPWALVVASFGGTGLFLVVATGNWRFWVYPDGVQVRDGLGRVGRKRLWSEIKSLDLGWRSYVFETYDGVRLKAPIGAPGTLELLQIAAGKGPRVDPKLQTLLKALSDR